MDVTAPDFLGDAPCVRQVLQESVLSPATYWVALVAIATIAGGIVLHATAPSSLFDDHVAIGWFEAFATAAVEIPPNTVLRI